MKILRLLFWDYRNPLLGSHMNQQLLHGMGKRFLAFGMLTPRIFDSRNIHLRLKGKNYRATGQVCI